MKLFCKIKGAILLACLIILVGCSSVPKTIDFSKPIEVTSLSDNAWVVDVGKALDRPSRYKLSRVEAAKEAEKRGCEFFNSDSLLNEELSTLKGQRAYRCVADNSGSIFVTQELLIMENL